MNKIISIFIIFLFLSCSKDNKTMSEQSNFDCKENNLEIVSDNKICDENDTFLVCESIIVEDVNFISEENFEWIPSACKDIGETVTYKKGEDSTEFLIVAKDHYILEEKLNLSCNGNYEFITYVCQKNEVLIVEFLNEKFGLDTISLELRTIINTYDDQSANPKVDQITLYQYRSNTNIANFHRRHFIGDKDYDYKSRTYHDRIALNGNIYNDVVEFKVSKNSITPPQLNFYLHQDRGLLGFKIDNSVWLKTN